MRAIDTNVLVRLIVRDDAKQAAAADAFVRDGAWVSHLVLAETFWVLTSGYGLTATLAGKVVEALLDHESLVIQDADAVRAALRRCRTRRGSGFTDCLILEVAARAGQAPLGTFDRHLAKQAGAYRLLAMR